MALSLAATEDTVIKRYAIDSSGIDDPKDKFDLPKDEKIAIGWYRSALNNHWEFELQSPKGGFFNWFAFKDHVQINDSTRKLSPSTSSLSSQVMAFLDMIAWAEGTDRAIGDSRRTGYDIIFTFDRFSRFTDHPRRIRCAGSLCSDAAGRYQFLSTTWDSVAEALHLPNFLANSQDIGAAELLRRRGVLNDVEAGRVRAACRQVSWEWASIPYNDAGDGRYGQPTITFDKAESLFVAAGGIVA
jgi:muramidase (phage lysozyme)